MLILNYIRGRRRTKYNSLLYQISDICFNISQFVSVLFLCPYSLSHTFSLYLLPFRYLQKGKQVPGITHSRGHTLRQPGGVLFSFHCNSGAFCCGPGNVLVSKCVYAYVWCLVVRQFDQSADAKVWRAKWPLHSQTHTATANLETSWKIISSICMLCSRPAGNWRRGKERRDWQT